MTQEQSKGSLPAGLNAGMNISHCPGCGTLAYSADHYCARCGWSLKATGHKEHIPEQGQGGDAGRCRECGGSVTHPVAYFCTDCGAGL